MAGSLGAYAENKLLDHLFAVSSFTPPTDIYMALFVGDPTDAGSGGAELTGNNYSRVQVNTWDAAATVDGKARTANTSAITFPTPSDTWGTPDHWVLFDAAEAGNLLWHGEIDAPLEILADDLVEFAAGALDLAWSGSLADALAEALLDHLMKVAPYTAPAAWWLALSTADPTSDGSGVAEPAALDGYARKQISAWDAAATVGGKGATANTPTVTFPQATGDWGTITWLALFDAETNGNFLMRAQLITPRNIVAGNIPRLVAGNLGVTLE